MKLSKIVTSDSSFIDVIAKDIRGSAVMVFIDASIEYQRMALALVSQLRLLTSVEWDLVIRGRAEAEDSNRTLIFISHANPEDNEFVLWLQTQLTRQGYDVWSDLTSLSGGELFWESIEDVIRNRAIRVLVVVSRASMSKPGVMDEVSLAVAVERSQKIPGFVIPIRVDDLAFGDLRANLTRKNVLDFNAGWAGGLSRLVESLERDHVARIPGSGAALLAKWWTDRAAGPRYVVAEEEPLVSNQFDVPQIPRKLFVFRGNPTHRSLASVSNSGGTSFPFVRFRDYWLTFLSTAELGAANWDGLVLERTVLADEILNGNIQLVRDVDVVARTHLIHRLWNRQWNYCLSERGLLEAARQKSRVMYFPKELLERDRAEFVDITGVRRRRNLVGYSRKRDVYWHLGVTGRFRSGHQPSMTLGLTVVFTKDGKADLVQPERASEIRRAFCKYWWNDRWRTLQAAAMSWLAAETDCIVAHRGEGGLLEIRSAARVFVSPLAVRETEGGSTPIDEDGSDVDADQDDSDVVEDDPPEDYFQMDPEP